LLITKLEPVCEFLANPQFVPTKVSLQDLDETYLGNKSLTTLVLT